MSDSVLSPAGEGGIVNFSFVRPQPTGEKLYLQEVLGVDDHPVRDLYTMCYELVGVADAGTVSVPHGLSIAHVVRIWGFLDAAGGLFHNIPRLPPVGSPNPYIFPWLDATNINVKMDSGASDDFLGVIIRMHVMFTRS